MTRRRPGQAGLIVSGMLLAGVLVAACGSSGSVGTPVPTTTVDLPASYRFAPTDISVKTGSTVTWTNHDNFTHSVQFLDGTSAEPLVMKPGESTTFTFKTVGTFRYECSFHPQQMKGTVIVTP